LTLDVGIGSLRRSVPWAGLRQVVMEACRALGADRVEAAIRGQHRVLGRAALDEPPGASAALDVEGGLFLGALPNAFLRDGVIYRAWRGLFETLFANERVLLRV